MQLLRQQWPRLSALTGICNNCRIISPRAMPKSMLDSMNSKHEVTMNRIDTMNNNLYIVYIYYSSLLSIYRTTDLVLIHGIFKVNSCNNKRSKHMCRVCSIFPFLSCLGFLDLAFLDVIVTRRHVGNFLR